MTKSSNNHFSLFLKCALIFGILFLYIPLIILIIYSFNGSKNVTVWGGFSFKWYIELFENKEILSAAWLSIRLAVISSFSAVILGTLAAYALSKIKVFKGSTFFTSMIFAPMVMPEVITGLSLLMLFFQSRVLLGYSGLEFLDLKRGFWTIWVGHTTIIMAYVTILIQARLGEVNKYFEEAAKDLGAKPLKVFFVITLPLIFPAILSGFLLGITLSFDDLVISSFLSGQGSTLPQMIYSKVRRGLDPQMNVLATLIIVVVGTVIITGNYILIKQQTKSLRKNIN